MPTQVFLVSWNLAAWFHGNAENECTVVENRLIDI